MALENILGKMGNGTKGSGNKTRLMGLADINGLMEHSIKGSGSMENKRDSESILNRLDSAFEGQWKNDLP
jgi:hypothetical protein